MASTSTTKLWIGLAVGLLGGVYLSAVSQVQQNLQGFTASNRRTSAVEAVLPQLQLLSTTTHSTTTTTTTTTPGFVSLSSGWDEVGQRRYKERMAQLTGWASNGEQMYQHFVLPLDNTVKVRTVGDPFFQNYFDPNTGRPRWEPKTFQTFTENLVPNHVRYYVGFGTWIGPTILFAAPFVDMAFGIEADPVAFASVEMNVALNRPYHEWASHIYLTPQAVRAGSNTTLETVPLEMKSSSPGNSCSGLGETVANCGARAGTDASAASWKVHSNTLPSLLQLWQVPMTQELFIKVDIESYECFLVPSWSEWLQSLKLSTSPETSSTAAGDDDDGDDYNNNNQRLPTFYIAFHSQIATCTEEQYGAIYQFAQLFPDEPQHSYPHCLDDDRKLWTCGTGEFLFRDWRY